MLGLKEANLEELQTLSDQEKIPYYLRRATPDLEWTVRFRIIAAKASRNNKRSGHYTKTEVPIRDELIRLGFSAEKAFLHQYRIFGYYGCKGQNVYYWMDFFIPSLLLDIEADGEIWHTFFDMKKRDRFRDSSLRKRYGIKVVRLSSYHIRKKRLGKILCRVISKRQREIDLKFVVAEG
jgi:very-short-patch-repair endonuclease